MKIIRGFIVALCLCLILAALSDAKSFSGGGRSSSSGGRSFSSGSKSSFGSSSSSKSFSSSSSKSSGFSSSSKTYRPSSKIFTGSTYKFNNVSKTISFKPKTYAPTGYGKYSGYYYSHPGDFGISSNNLMFYLALDSMTDSAVMMAMANKGPGYDSWKAEALASDNKELKDKVAQLEAKMSTINATSVNASYVDPDIQKQIQDGINGTSAMIEAEDEIDTDILVILIAFATVILGVGFFARGRKF